ncbi:MAG TPA: hypothetical protein VGD33_02630 [Chitinophagaceae bacterium]
MMLRSKIIVFIVAVIASAVSHAQFRQKSNLASPATAGFYSISPAPAFTKYSKADLSDIRIVDEDNKQVPFIWQPFSQTVNTSSFFEVPILLNRTDTAVTTLQFDLANTDGTDQLQLTIANTAVMRSASLSGSNDRNNWYIISENLLLASSAKDSTDQFLQTISFPYSKYQYLKLQIYNAKSDPVHIIKAGIHIDSTYTSGLPYHSNPSTSFKQTDTIRESILFISNPESHLTERFAFRISGSRFYKRDGYVYDNENRLLATFQVSSDRASTVNFTPNKSKQFRVVIENGDNPPLHFDAIRAEQLSRQMIAYLQPGKQYSLLTGDSNVVAASYDLAHFTDSIPANLPVLTHAEVIPNEAVEVRTASYKDFWIWPFIIIMILLLGYLSFRLVHDMKKREA